MSRGRGVLLGLLLIAACLAVAGCGGGEDSAGEAPPPPARAEDFPAAEGKTILQVRDEVKAEGPILAPSVSQFTSGEDRFGFALFDRAKAQIADAPVAVYVARAGGGKAQGPFLAKYESLAVKTQYQSQSSAADPDSAKSLYVAKLEGLRPGTYDVLGVTRLDGRLVAASSAGGGIKVAKKGPVPAVGELAPRIDTETKADVGGDLTKIDTRVPPSSMHDVNFADVLGRKPVVLLFATPQLCQSRVCGPVADVAEQVKADRGDEIDFVHQEIFKNNEIDQGRRPQVEAWNLPTEPWLFTMSADGRVAARIEGAYSAKELNAAIDAAVKPKG